MNLIWIRIHFSRLAILIFEFPTRPADANKGRGIVGGGGGVVSVPFLSNVTVLAKLIDRPVIKVNKSHSDYNVLKIINSSLEFLWLSKLSITGLHSRNVFVCPRFIFVFIKRLALCSPCLSVPITTIEITSIEEETRALLFNLIIGLSNLFSNDICTNLTLYG